MEVGFKWWDLFADWCPTNSWNSGLAVSDSFWQAQEEVFRFLGRHYAVIENHKSQLKTSLGQAQQLDHADTCPNTPLYYTVCKQTWCTRNKIVAELLYQRHIITEIIIARGKKEPLWASGSTKRGCTDPPTTITCLSSDGMNPHEEALRLGRFLKCLKVWNK